MPEYLKLDSRKVTYREYWNIARSPGVILPWVAKLLNIPLTFGSPFQRVEYVHDLEIAEDVFSIAAREGLQASLDQFLSLGFHSPRFFCFKTLGGETETSFIAVTHNSGQCSARLMHSVSTIGSISKSNVVTMLLSELSDGTWLVTVDQRQKFRSAPGITVHRLLKGTPAQLLELHQRELSMLQAQNPHRMIDSPETMDSTWDRYENYCNDFGIQRGLYVPLKAEEHEAVVKRLETLKEFKTQGVEHAEVLAAVNQLQAKERGWGNAILIFVISLFLFVVAGVKQWSWEYALMLVPILFVHELGHYVAMRSFNYRNLRMFFIPFFGAAVAGRSYNVAGWKKVVVSLMGPVPGIVLGAVIGGLGLVLHQSLLTKVALVTLILNGFNLLPVLPLDGGWVFHTLIFSRHHLLDAAFRILAIVGLALLGMLTHTKFLMYLGIPLLMGIPAANRVARVAAALRKRGVPLGSLDDQTIPAETAQIIITELKPLLPKAHTTKMVAEQTLQVFETLNARPPGWLATTGLLFAHCLSVGLAVVFAIVLILGRRGDLSGIMAAATQAPKHKLTCNSITLWRGSHAPALVAEGTANTLIATFPSISKATMIFQTLTNKLPTNATLRLFGETLLLSLPVEDTEARKRWLAELQHQTRSVFVENTNFVATFSISCLAPSEAAAKELESELEEYLHTFPTEFLAPPWMPNDQRSPEKRAQHQLARKTYLKLLENDESTDREAMDSLRKKMTAARRQGDKVEMDSLSDKMRQLFQDAQRRHIESLRSGERGPVDIKVVDLFVAQQAESLIETNREETLQPTMEMARLMGQVTGDETRFLVRYGGVTRKAQLLSLNWVSFVCMSEGTPALANWLCSKGCTDLRYNFQTGFDGE